MLEKVMLAISLASTGIWLPYDHQIKPSEKSEEYYASVQVMNTSGTKNLTDQSLADQICCYTNREVMAYYYPNDYTPKKFYYTYDTTHPIINYIVPLENDMSSVQYALYVLEREANLTNTVENNDLNNITLGYLRSFRKEYSGDPGTTTENEATGWRILTGLSESVQNSFSIIESKRKYHDSVRDFFARYAENDRYYSSRHGTTSASNGWKDSVTTLPDPYKEGDIDLIHMFASIDGALKYTYFHSKEEAGRLFFPGNMNHDILGWAGDLQSCMNNRLIDRIDNLTSFSDVMKIPGTFFSPSDFLADIDAFNIAKLCDQNMTLYTAFTQYYDSLSGDKLNRYTYFINNVVKEKTYDSWDGTRKDIFRKEVHMMLALKWDGSEYKDVYNDSSKKIVYHLLKQGTYDQRKKIANMFTDYILSKESEKTGEVESK